MITNKELTDIIISYRAGNVSRALFQECFVKLAEWVFQQRSYYFSTNNYENLINGAAGLCVNKAERFDEQRGKAFNFFVTIIGCFIKQEHRRHMNKRVFK